MSHLCTTCRRLMCQDCLEIADEYAELLQNWKQRYANLEWKFEELQKEIGKDKRRADRYEDIAKTGLPELLHEWAEWKVKS